MRQMRMRKMPMRKRLGLALLPAALELFVTPAQAWDSTGHMMVAAIAHERMTPQARALADRLLRRNPDYATWTAGVAPADRAHTAFVHAATWADDIKGRPGFTSQGDTATAPAATRIVDYSDKREHRYWHFVDIAFSPDGTPVQPPPPGNAQTMIGVARTVLASGSQASASARSYALVWLLHLVGDIHQPLHAAERVTAQDPDGDRGGNADKVCTTRCGQNLHALWDDVLGEGLTPTEAIAAARQLPPAPTEATRIGVPGAWARESNALAASVVYTPAIRTDGQPSQLDAAYLAQAEATAKAQVALAGARLAKLLNATLPQR